MRNLLKQLFTEVDNSTFDLSKFLVTCVIVNGVVLSLWNHTAFDMNNYGMGMAALITSAAAIFHFKKDSSDSSIS